MSSINSCDPKTPLQAYAREIKEAGQPSANPADAKNILKEKAAAAIAPEFTPDPKKLLDIQA